jgi:ethanolaminephosphotransferase
MDYVSWIFFFSLHRIAERWNQTGQKYAGSPDIVHDVLEPVPLVLWIFVFVAYAAITIRIAYHLPEVTKIGPQLAIVNAIILYIPSLAFKLSFTANDSPELLAWLSRNLITRLQQVPLVPTARIVFIQLVAELLMVLAGRFFVRRRYQQKDHTLAVFQDLLTLLLVAQTRTHNIPLYLIFLTQHAFLQQLRLSIIQIAFTTILLAHVSFFALGNSNAISSIDLSNAYNGVSGYNVVAVGFLVFISNWAGPIWWSVAGIQLLTIASDSQPQHEIGQNGKTVSKRTHSQREWISEEHRHLAKSVSAGSTLPTIPQPPVSSPFFTYLALWTFFVSTSLLAVMLSCTILRTHLFIWTVFSPKYLYAMAWTLGFHLLITVGLASAVWKFGSG